MVSTDAGAEVGAGGCASASEKTVCAQMALNKNPQTLVPITSPSFAANVFAKCPLAWIATALRKASL